MLVVEESEDNELEIREFLPRIQDELSRLKIKESYQTNSEALLHWAVRQISPTLMEKDVRQAIKAGQQGEHSIDAAWWDADAIAEGRKAGTYYLAHSRCPDMLSDIEHFPAEVAEELFSGFSWLTSTESGKMKRSLQQVKADLELRIAGGQRVRLAVVIGGLITAPLRNAVKAVNNQLFQAHHGLASIEVFDLRRLKSLYVDNLERGDLPPPEEVRFKIRTSYHKRGQQPRRALIAEIPVSQIFQLVDTHGLALFTKNLRVPLATSRFNKGIARTLSDPLDSKNLWYYNNGITAICHDFDFDEMEDTDDAFETVIAHDFTVVNGCQTCETIHNTLKEWQEQGTKFGGVDDPDVLIRVVETGDDAAQSGGGTFARSVARYTNSQNPITGRNLRANDPEQTRLREHLRSRGFFLETKPGEWDRRIVQDPEYALLFARIDPVLDNEEGAQYSLAFWLDSPVLAKMGKRRIFEEDSIYQSVFGFDTFPETFLLPWLVAALEDQWRRASGYLKRAPRGKRRNRISRPMVYTHGNLIILAMLGYGLRGNSRPDLGRDSVRLGRACDVLTQVLEGSDVGAVNTAATEKTLNKTFDHYLELLYNYVAGEMKKDPELSVRNLLVRDTCWTDIMTRHGKEIVTGAKPLKEMLLGS